MSAVKKVGQAALGAATGFLTGGPAGAITGGLGGLFGGNPGGTQQVTSQVPIPGAPNTVTVGGSGNSIVDWLRNNAGTVGTGAALAALLGHGNPIAGLKNTFNGLTTPQTLNDPRNQLLSAFSNQFAGALGGNGANLGELLQKIGSTQGYQGPLSAGFNSGQTDATSGLADFIKQFQASGGGASALDPLKAIAGGSNIGVPDSIQSVLNGSTPDILKLIAAGGDSLSPQIQDMVANNPAIAALLGSANSASPSQSVLNNIAQTGGGADFNSIASAIQSAMQPQVDRGLRDLREKFGFQGLGDSTPAGQAGAQYLSDASTGIAGQLAQIAPQIFGQDVNNRIAAATGAANTGTSALSAAGQLGATNAASLIDLLKTRLAAGSGMQSGSLGSAGILSQIFGNQQNQQTQAALGLPGATSSIESLLPSLFGQQFGMGQQQFGDTMQNLMNQFGGFQQSQSLIPQFLGMISNTGQPMTYGSPLSQLTNGGASLALMMKLLQG